MRKKTLIALVTAVLALQATAYAEKDRGGEVVPYAEGSSSVMLNRTYSKSLLTITGPSARLLFDSLSAPAKASTNPFVLRGTHELVKEKDNVSCVVTIGTKKAYKCTVVIIN